LLKNEVDYQVLSHGGARKIMMILMETCVFACVC